MIDQKDNHYKVVEDWTKKNTAGLTSDQQVLLFEKAIHVIEQRALVTLSSITLTAILDRVLHQSKEKFPILSQVKTNPKNLDFRDLIKKNKTDKSEDLIEALFYLLVEMLRVIGRLTADILTKPLHQELLKLSWNDLEQA